MIHLQGDVYKSLLGWCWLIVFPKSASKHHRGERQAWIPGRESCSSVRPPPRPPRPFSPSRNAGVDRTGDGPPDRGVGEAGGWEWAESHDVSYMYCPGKEYTCILAHVSYVHLSVGGETWLMVPPKERSDSKCICYFARPGSLQGFKSSSPPIKGDVAMGSRFRDGLPLSLSKDSTTRHVNLSSFLRVLTFPIPSPAIHHRHVSHIFTK